MKYKCKFSKTSIVINELGGVYFTYFMTYFLLVFNLFIVVMNAFLINFDIFGIFFRPNFYYVAHHQMQDFLPVQIQIMVIFVFIPTNGLVEINVLGKQIFVNFELRIQCSTELILILGVIGVRTYYSYHQKKVW